MTVVAEQNASFEASTLPGLFDTGLVGTLGIRLDDGAGGNVIPRSTAGIFESPATATIYGIPEGVMTAPGALGSYLIVWDDGAGTWASEDLIVVAAGSTIQPIPPPAPPALPEASSGPCSAWADSDYVLEICSDNAESTDPSIFDPWVTIASDILFRLSGRQFPGSCSMTVRPCGTGGICAGWAWPLTAQEYGWLMFANYGGTWGWWWPDGRQGCGCQHVSRVHLPDYPVTAVSEVTIDGVIIDPATYALREFRFLDRLDEAVWPSCQDMRLELGEEGTWGVTYTWGAPIPASGVLAAAALACELYADSVGAECRLPQGVTSINRQGVSIELTPSWGRKDGVWFTGISEVDAFLQATNPFGLVAPTTVWSPDLEPFPRPDYA